MAQSRQVALSIAAAESEGVQHCQILIMSDMLRGQHMQLTFVTAATTWAIGTLLL